MPTIDRSIGNYHDSSHARIRKIGRYAGPAAYVVGGDPLVPADVGLGKIEALLLTQTIDSGVTATHVLVYDHAHQKVVWFAEATGVEVVVGTDLSTFAARFEAIGY